MLYLSSPRRRLFTLLGAVALLGFVPLQNQAQCPDFTWALSGQGQERDEAHGLGIDAAGNAYLSGWFDSDTLNFGSGVLAINSSLGQNGNGDAYLVKVAPDGTPLWARTAGGSDNSDWCWASSTAPSGRTAIAGEFYSNTMDFGGGVSLTKSSLASAFVAVYETDGSLAWARLFGTTGSTGAFGVAFGPDGAVYATGNFEGSVSFADSSVVSQGGDDLFLAVWNADGSERWARSMGGPGFVGGNDIAVAPDGMIYVSGRTFSDPVFFAGGSENNLGLSDVMLLAFGPDGSEQHWFYAAGTSGDEAAAVAVDDDGRVYASGAFFSTDLDFDGSTLVSNGAWDIWLSRFSPDLVPEWIRVGGGTGTDRAYALDIDPAGNPVLSGQSGNNSFSLGGFTLDQQGVLYAGFDSTGTGLWAESYGGNLPQFDASYAVAAAPTGDVFFGVKFLSATIDFGAGITLQNGGGFANSEVGLVGRKSPLGLRLGAASPDEDVCAGSTVIFSVNLLAPVPDSLEFAWQHDGVPIAGATDPDLVLTAVDTADAGIYACLVSSPCESMLSASSQLMVRPAPPAPVLAFTAGGDSILAAGPGDTFVWTLDGTLLPFVGPAIPASGSGAYSATAILAGCPGPASAPLLLSSMASMEGTILSIHPQPATDVLIVRGLVEGTWTLTLSDLRGSISAQATAQVQGGAASWSLPVLAPGMYVLAARSAEGRDNQFARLVLIADR